MVSLHVKKRFLCLKQLREMSKSNKCQARKTTTYPTLLVKPKKLYTATPNSSIRKLCTVLCGRNVHKLSAPTEVKWKGLKLWCDITAQQNKFTYWWYLSTFEYVCIIIPKCSSHLSFTEIPKFYFHIYNHAGYHRIKTFFGQI